MSHVFDKAYYQRFYFDRKTRVIDRKHVDRLGNFVCSYVHYMRLPVARVLDVGCGIGLWQAVIKRHFPRARYTGVEFSEYLCRRYGWEHGSVVDYEAKVPFDLVICQGVLPYLDERDAKRALKNLSTLCRGALYLEAVTREDWDRGIIDQELTDNGMHARPERFYQRGLAKSFQAAGGGVFVSRACEVPLYALERG